MKKLTNQKLNQPHLKNNRNTTPQPHKHIQPQPPPKLKEKALTPLRSNLKKPSQQPSQKKVIIKDPIQELHIKNLMTQIAKFFINKIIQYQQIGLETLKNHVQLQTLKEIQLITLQKEKQLKKVFQSWAHQVKTSKNNKQSYYQTQKFLSQPIQTQKDLIESQIVQILHTNLKQYVLRKIFTTWRQEFNKTQISGTFNVKDLKIAENLQRFLKNNEGDSPRIILDIKLTSSDQQIIKNHTVFSKIIKFVFVVSPRPQAISPKPYAPSKHQRVKTQECPTTPNKIIHKEKRSDSKNIINNSFSQQKSTKAVLAVNNRSATSLKQQDNKERISKKLFHDKSKPSQNTIFEKQDLNISNDGSINIKLQEYLKDDTKILTSQVFGNPQNIEPLCTILSSIFMENCIDIFNYNKLEKLRENQIDLQRQETLKRRILFNWNQLLPEMKIEKFQIKFRILKLFKPFKRHAFQLIKDFKRIDHHPLNYEDKMSWRIKQFLNENSPEKKNKK